jgi:muramoyltetrapeptide carboxypeptidase
MSARAAALPLRLLRPGDRVAVVAPSSPFDAGDLAAGVEALRARYDVRHAPDILERRGYFAGDDARRLRELRAAIEDDAVAAIVAARGGYGATRLLADLPAALVATHPKLLVGFSDVTALHALWARAGLASIHGPMVAMLGRIGGLALERFVAAVEGTAPLRFTDLCALAAGRAAGRLVGGNLAVLAALVGTPYAPPLDDAVLFLEDVGERPYRVDRMLTTLLHAGWLSRVRAIALGAFTDATAGSDGVTIDEVLRERLAGLGVPVVAGLPAGHVDDNHPIVLGARVVVDADAGSLTLEESS